MTVTAKLSRKFYETLGDEITNELVDWLGDVFAIVSIESPSSPTAQITKWT